MKLGIFLVCPKLAWKLQSRSGNDAGPDANAVRSGPHKFHRRRFEIMYLDQLRYEDFMPLTVGELAVLGIMHQAPRHHFAIPKPLRRYLAQLWVKRLALPDKANVWTITNLGRTALDGERTLH